MHLKYSILCDFPDQLFEVLVVKLCCYRLQISFSFSTLYVE